ncbi:hypothetical protein EJ076_34755 [Mesorhizobium sp. M7D.F.Ca.US.005.01.1.1]|uniref:hypothetical protein n=1 Tax=Mesorhizobium sp. M7D.F.Ca.US.005.01.1.1 TaxID=2493678 RepID=UPI000F7625F1|nr:hypothetical protein [Mesorhizobium sp. M7D.F.Ca.US.005.01.1.1]AZO45880.1 hypothetical protein EJ076_34755 [Mesorhizobium sp. M7D.F.Ca.US.005.01.1.1]
MPIFEIQGPDGSTYEVDAPDQNAAVNAFHGMNSQPAAPPPNPIDQANARAQAGIANAQHLMAQGGPQADPQTVQPPGVPTYQPPGVTDSYDPKTGDYTNYGTDAAKSGVSGLRQGVEGIGGMMGDASQMSNDAAQWAAQHLGASPETAQTIGDLTGKLNPWAGMMPTTSDVRSLTDAVVGPAYQPKTTPGEYVRTIGQFAPNALMGPAGFLERTASTVIPAVASETAGQLTKGTPFEPYARAGAAIAGGLGVNKMLQPGAQALPTAEDIKASAGYKDLKAPMKAAVVDKPTYQGIVNQLDGVAQDFGMVPEQHGAFETILARHAANAEKGGASLQDLEILRRSLLNAGKAPLNPSAGELSRQLIGKLDETVNGLGGANLVNAGGQTADETLSALQDARSIWKTGVKSDIIEQAVERAKNAASGYENGLRNEFRKLLNNKTYKGTFNDTERVALQQVVRGTPTSNALRFLGGFGVPLDNGRNFLGSVMGGGVGSTLGAAVAGPVGAAVGGPALIAAGTLAKQASSAMTGKSALLAEALVKAGPDASRLFSEAMAQSSAAGKQALLQAMMQAKLSVQPQPAIPAPVRQFNGQ